MGEWTGFFEAELGAAAALAGLVIVAISINISHILSNPILPGRAAETLILPSGALVACSFALVPHQPGWVLAWEMGLTGIVVWASTIYLQIYAGRSDLPGVKAVHRFRLVLRVLLCQSSTLPFIVAGALFYAGDPAALYWIAGGVIASLIVAVLNAWVLLVEILR